MTAPTSFITIQIYDNQEAVGKRVYRDPPKPAAEILESLRDSGMVGDLRAGNVPLSKSDFLQDATYQLHLRDPGVMILNMSFLHRRRVLAKSCLILAT